MNILLVYPQYPDTFWSFKHALKFISKKSGKPTIGFDYCFGNVTPSMVEKVN